MQFSSDMIEKILRGEKFQTRRPAKDGETCDTGLFVRQRNNRIKWALYCDYAICPGRGKKAVARMRLTGIRQERAIDISEADARAEGFEGREAFWDKLRSLYGKNVDPNAMYWVLEFVLVEGGAA